MKKLFLLFLITGTILPSFTSIPSAEAGFSPEGIPKRPRNFSPEGRPRPRKRCKTDGKVVVCRVPRKPRKCTLRRPCIPRGYYRPNPPIYPMPTLPTPPGNLVPLR